MHLHRGVKIQLVVLTVIALVALTVMSLHFVKLPAMLFGVGRYTVKMELPQAAGLYSTGNVTYRGTESSIDGGAGNDTLVLAASSSLLLNDAPRWMAR